MPQDDAPQLAAAPAAVEYRTPNTFCGVYILRRRTMPQRQRRPTKNTQLGPYDLSTRRLPGGTEIEALGAGYARMLAYGNGYSSAATEDNQRLLKDTKNAYVVDKRPSRGASPYDDSA